MRGAVWRAVLIVFVIVGAWVTIGKAYESVRPLLRYLTVASIGFTLGRLSGRRSRKSS